MTTEEKLLRLLSDLDQEIQECRSEAAKLSGKSDILAKWRLKIEREVLNKITFP